MALLNNTDGMPSNDAPSASSPHMNLRITISSNIVHKRNSSTSTFTLNKTELKVIKSKVRSNINNIQFNYLRQNVRHNHRPVILGNRGI